MIGTTDKVTLTNWYLGDQYKVETIKDSSNLTLTASDIAALVSAMATVTAPALGVTTLSTGSSTYSTITNAINNAWH